MGLENSHIDIKQLWEWMDSQIDISNIEQVVWRVVSGLIDMHNNLVSENNRLKSTNKELARRLRLAKGWGFVYIFKGADYYKIGYSNRPPRRMIDISPKLPFSLRLICSIETNNAIALEAKLHQQFADKRLRGEWFSLNECDISAIKELGDQHGKAQII